MKNKITLVLALCLLLPACEVDDSKIYHYSDATWEWSIKDDEGGYDAVAKVSNDNGDTIEIQADVTCVTVDSTCTKEGSKTYIATITSSDGVTYTDTKVDMLALIDHSYTVEEGTEATFTHPGLTSKKYCSVCGYVLEEQQEIPQLKYSDYSFVVSFNKDNPVSELNVYPNNDSSSKSQSDVAYTYDNDGNLTKDGTGNVFFDLQFKEGYKLDRITIDGNYERITKDSSGIYGIYNISSDLTVNVISTQLEFPKVVTNLASNIDDTGIVSFEWDNLSPVTHTDVDVNCDGVVVLSKSVTSNAFEYCLEDNKNYQFTFTPVFSSGLKGKSEIVHHAYCPEAKDINFARMEITTENNVLPTYDQILPPSKSFGEGITNNDYVQSSIELYDSTGSLLFDSKSMLKDTSNDYSGSKIKIRGNTSAYATKKPYKIKLNKKVDLLNGLFERTVNVGYKNKEFLLLNQGQRLNYFVGREVGAIVGEEYEFAYSYVSLFVNGDYQGLYVLTDSVNEKTCNVSDSGYVIENDAYWWNEDLYFTTGISTKARWINFGYTFKYPDTDTFTTEDEVCTYIQNYLNSFEELLFEKDNECLNYIDVDSFAKWLLAHDILGAGDGAGTNMYYTKYDNGESLLKAGPLWDFDSSFINMNNRAQLTLFDFTHYKFLIEMDGYNQAFRLLFDSIKDTIVDSLETAFINDFYTAELDELIAIDNKAYGNNNPTASQSFTSIKNWLSQHIDWLEEHLDV